MMATIGLYTQVVSREHRGFVIAETTWQYDPQPPEPMAFDGFLVGFEVPCSSDASTERCKHSHSLRAVGFERYDWDQCFVEYEWTIPRLIYAPGDDGGGEVCFDCVLEAADVIKTMAQR